VDADPVRLRQVLDNLLANAAVHTPPGTAVHVTVAVEGDEAVVRVTDAGPRIAPEADRSGSSTGSTASTTPAPAATAAAGLGLSVVQSLVTAHGGTVDYHG
jgi:two-component system OmpR family sensor kinase